MKSEPRMVWNQLILKAKEKEGGGKDEIQALAEALVEGPWTEFLNQARGQKWAA
jgi:hypothetical protein